MDISISQRKYFLIDTDIFDGEYVNRILKYWVRRIGIYNPIRNRSSEHSGIRYLESLCNSSSFIDKLCRRYNLQNRSLLKVRRTHIRNLIHNRSKVKLYTNSIIIILAIKEYIDTKDEYMHCRKHYKKKFNSWVLDFHEPEIVNFYERTCLNVLGSKINNILQNYLDGLDDGENKERGIKIHNELDALSYNCRDVINMTRII